MTTYRERHLAGLHEADKQAVESEAENEEPLPGRHAALDELAAERGVEWSREDLTVAEKQAELE